MHQAYPYAWGRPTAAGAAAEAAAEADAKMALQRRFRRLTTGIGLQDGTGVIFARFRLTGRRGIENWLENARQVIADTLCILSRAEYCN